MSPAKSLDALSDKLDAHQDERRRETAEIRKLLDSIEASVRTMTRLVYFILPCTLIVAGKILFGS